MLIAYYQTTSQHTGRIGAARQYCCSLTMTYYDLWKGKMLLL